MDATSTAIGKVEQATTTKRYFVVVCIRHEHYKSKKQHGSSAAKPVMSFRQFRALLIGGPRKARLLRQVAPIYTAPGMTKPGEEIVVEIYKFAVPI
jgi:hypothetical protein